MQDMQDMQNLHDMHKPLFLDTLYSEYSEGGLDRREFERHIITYILSNHRQFYFPDWSKERCVDYLCDLYPRLRLAIDSYKNVGSSFETYIKSKLYWFVRERRTQESDHRITEYAYWESCALEHEALVCEEETEYLTIQHWGGKKVANPRQALILVLKAYHFISDEFASRIAPALEMPLEQLIRLLDAIRSRRFERDQQIRQFKEYLHSQYHRCISFEQRLKAIPEGSSRYTLMLNRLVRARKRYASMQKRFKSVSFGAANWQVAEVLGIPKGTVDSNIYALKQRFKRFETLMQMAL